MAPLLGARMQGLPLRAALTLCEKDNSHTLSDPVCCLSAE